MVTIEGAEKCVSQHESEGWEHCAKDARKKKMAAKCEFNHGYIPFLINGVHRSELGHISDAELNEEHVTHAELYCGEGGLQLVEEEPHVALGGDGRALDIGHVTQGGMKTVN